MATARLALVGVIGNYTGPWMSAKGNEHGVVVSELVSGEEVWLDRDGPNPVHVKSGFTPLTTPLAAGEKYRFRKIISDGCRPEPTTVRISLNGVNNG